MDELPLVTILQADFVRILTPNVRLFARVWRLEAYVMDITLAIGDRSSLSNLFVRPAVSRVWESNATNATPL